MSKATPADIQNLRRFLVANPGESSPGTCQAVVDGSVSATTYYRVLKEVRSQRADAVQEVVDIPDAKKLRVVRICNGRMFKNMADAAIAKSVLLECGYDVDEAYIEETGEVAILWAK
jgi:phage tail sheath protein FI